VLPLRVDRRWARVAVWGEWAAALAAIGLGVGYLCCPGIVLATATVGVGGIALGWWLGVRLMHLAVNPLSTILEVAAQDCSYQRHSHDSDDNDI